MNKTHAKYDPGYYKLVERRFFRRGCLAALTPTPVRDVINSDPSSHFGKHALRRFDK